MNRPKTSHPDELQLLRWADGELPARQAAQVRPHVEACWQCRTRMEQLQETLAAYAQYREALLESHLPLPPQPWVDIRHSLRELDASREISHRWKRLVEWPHTGPARVWILAAAAMLLICVALFRFVHPRPVSAAELLRKAAARESPADPSRRLRVKTRTRTFTRSASIGHENPAPELSVLFAAARYNWEKPLSIASYVSWRAQLADKHDEVTPLAAPGSRLAELYRIRTTTSFGTLTEATLTLRSQDLRPVSGRFLFRSNEWVEIEEIPTDAKGVFPVQRAQQRPFGVSSLRTAHAPRAGTPAGPSQELHVIAALHALGADLGDPVEITRSGPEQLLVTGTGLDSQRQEEVRSALAALPGVVVRFEEPGPANIRAYHSPRETVSRNAGKTTLELQLQSRLGEYAPLEKLTNHVLDSSEIIMARAHALRVLAERFPPEVESRLDAADRTLLLSLRRRHAEALVRGVEETAAAMRPILEVPQVRRDPMDESPPVYTSLAVATRALFDAAQRVDRLLSTLLVGTDSNVNLEQAALQLAAELSRLETQARTYLARMSGEH